MSEESLVTLIRRRVIYEEWVLTAEEFKSMNDDDFIYKLDNFKDGGFDDNFMNEDSYIAFQGDVTDRSDDYIYCLPRRTRWSKNAPIKVVPPPHPYQ